MANSDYDWNSFMQSRHTRLIMYGMCVFFCAFYAVDGVREFLDPERSAMYVQAMGATTYTIITVARFVVLLVTAGAFGRMWFKVFREADK